VEILDTRHAVFPAFRLKPHGSIAHTRRETILARLLPFCQTLPATACAARSCPNAVPAAGLLDSLRDGEPGKPN